MSEHLGLDELADALAGDDQPHLATCAACRAALEQLRTATDLVGGDLQALALPPVPDGLAARISAALPASALPVPVATSTVLPAADVTPIGAARSRRTGWLATAAGVAAAAAAIVGGGLFLTSNATDTSKSATSAAGRSSGPPTTSSGTDYTDAALARALPSLLAGRPGGKAVTDSAQAPTAESAAGGSTGGTSAPLKTTGTDPLAVLRTTKGLASCLASLTEPTDSGVPLALDYASYKGTPALIVVLPAAKASKVEVWVVGPSCHDPESDLLYYVKLDRP